MLIASATVWVEGMVCSSVTGEGFKRSPPADWALVTILQVQGTSYFEHVRQEKSRPYRLHTERGDLPDDLW